ncbi:FAD-dependent oxidoreductase [Mucilaginibacter rubeus]|uniref:FAD-dependent oxidoreductase n=1 Tax=Mucilaginibacter rubeus TaxID=2027860 RepID=UPI00166C9C78|nr:FAD-dependent oxidoreductase [Mucilaginibacter rubeus]GGA96140.1 fused response regulator/thioredoxin-disulfide reductase [Mucilaginibacter rubeus]
MEKPIIISIDDDPQVSRAIAGDLKAKFGKSYRIVSSVSAKEVLESLPDLRNSGVPVALFLSDQRMPEMNGVTFLAEAMKVFPEAKKVLLTAYSDTEAAIKAINDIRLDYYLLKPWDPPEERLYPVLTDLLEDWQREYIPEFKGIKVIGFQYSSLTHTVKDYLASNLIPYQWLEVDESGSNRDILEINGIAEGDLPAIIYEDGTFEVSPSIRSIAAKIGRDPGLVHQIYDVVIVGSGPAGLAAAVYGASEGLKTLVIERKAPGGQAGTSSRIENYLGFPAGLSGADLTRRAVSQAKRLGAEFISPCTVTDIRQKDGYKIVILEDGREVVTRTLIVATGVDYRRLDVPEIDRLTGAGIYYGASTTEAGACRGRDVFILGGGNSAGQSAVYLSNFAKDVYILIRRDSLSYTMSAYLIDQLNAISNVHLITDSEVIAVAGGDRLETLTYFNSRTGNYTTSEASALYIFIGAKPYTDWIKLDVLRNDKGYILTGRELARSIDLPKIWKQTREPFLLETSCSGIFAAGDVRAGAMARVASAVGDGSMAISFIHKYLADQ